MAAGSGSSSGRQLQQRLTTSGGGLAELYKPRCETESYCTCPKTSGGTPSLTWIHCDCGEPAAAASGSAAGGLDWSWAEPESADCALSPCCRVVSFHPLCSLGTAAAVGNRPLTDGLHYWELKFVSPVYGTDMMVGVCSEGFSPRSHQRSFVSLLGLGPDSMGLSYNGYFQQNALKRQFCKQFGQGAILGILLDLWHGTLTYFLNRRCLGVAASGLKPPMYPVVCSTAAKSGVKLIRALSLPMSLQALCCRALRHLIPDSLCVTEALTLPPGLTHLLTNNLPYLTWPTFRQAAQRRPPPTDFENDSDSDTDLPKRRRVADDDENDL